MALNKREKMIALGVGAVLLLFVADYYVAEPFLAAQTDVDNQQARVSTQLNTAQGVYNNRHLVNDAWRGLLQNGLKTNAADAESGALHALTEWASGARVNLESHKSDTPVQVGDFQQIRITVTGSGGMAGISRLIWDIETGALPLQMGELRIQSRKDGTDDLGLQLTVTTLVFAPPPPPPDKKTVVTGGA